VNSISSSRSFSSFSFFLADLDLAVELEAFDAAFLVRVEVDEVVEDFFRDRAVSFEVFFVVMSAL
jgi:hypothetical protein